MEYRELGSTGERLSVLGFGGIVVMGAAQSEANRVVADAVSRGVRYFDVAPSYGDAEERLGPALEPYRKDVFLACKTTDRTGDGARRELENSLRHMKTDHFDLYQMHAMTSEDDLMKVLAPGGAIETLAKARQEGLIRYIGFSAHSAEIAVRLINEYDFDSILFPINFVTWNSGGFGPQIVDTARAKGMGILALKAMALRNWHDGEDRVYKNPWYKPIDDPEIVQLALRFTLSKHATAAIPPGDIQLWELALSSIEKHGIAPLDEGEMQVLLELSKLNQPIFKALA